MRLGLVTGIGMAVSLLGTSAVHAQTRWVGAPLPVRMIDLTVQRDDQRQVALETATAVLAAAGVRILWTLCVPAGRSETGCSAPLRDTERIVRVLETSPAWPQREGVSIGASVIDRQSQSGVLGTVYADRVSWMASRAAINPAVLLGRAIAHEMGHLLLGARHASAGIMRRSWTLQELRRSRLSDWQFTKEQIAVLAASATALRPPSVPRPSSSFRPGPCEGRDGRRRRYGPADPA